MIIRTKWRTWQTTSAAILALFVCAAARGEKPTAAAIAFFEKNVRPVLVESCQDCHSSDSAESDLELDSLAGMLKGGERGPAIVPGQPENSLLVRAIRHGELLKMPPKSKLPADQIAAIAEWIKTGAPWPNAEPIAPAKVRPSNEPHFTAEQRGFWAFQSPRRPKLPDVNDADWVRSPIDAFILARLEENGLAPAPRASNRALIRRVTFDLIGLPPTPEEIAAFEMQSIRDPQGAFRSLIDRLLASPHYGERWARHWLDVARYGDSNGLDENLAYAHAFRYRDYVVDAMNRDKPFDQFVREQIAGDLLPGGGDSHDQPQQVVATGFLCLGAKMLAEDDPVKLQMDIIDEQIDTVGRAFLGMTLGCARCHDHKFDPIAMSDYYALAGIFKSTKTMDTLSVVARWHERPLAAPEVVAAREAQQDKIAALQDTIQRQRDQAAAAVVAEARGHLDDYLRAAQAKRRQREFLKHAKPISDRQTDAASNTILIEAENFDRGNVLKDTTGYGKGIGVLVNAGPTPNFVEYDVEVPERGLYQLDVRYAAAGSRPCQLFVNGVAVKADVAGGVTGTWFPDSQRWDVEGYFLLKAGKNVLRLEHAQFFPHIDKLLLAPAPTDATAFADTVTTNGYDVIPEFVDQWVAYLDKTKSAAPADQPNGEVLRQIAEADDGPFAVPATIERHLPDSVVAELKRQRSEEKRLEEDLPEFPQAMAVDDQDPVNVRIHYRGNHLTLGEEVPRRFPLILAGDQSPIPGDHSGRLELAHWLTSPDHPLTARVFVNRVWQWHFGEGLVRTPDNFGRLGERPTHPELLDWLATEFVQSGWRIKDLHRLILSSATWQQSTAFNERAAALDVENRLWWRMPRRRLDVEAIRDSILAVSGNLDRTFRGSLLPTENRKYVTSTANVDPVVYVSNRRSIYLPVVRSALYDVFQAFDFPEPSVSNSKRQTTTVAPQALFMMNSQFVAEQTRHMAQRLLAETALDDAGRVRQLWVQAYAREPNDDELHAARDFVAGYEVRWQSERPKLSSEARLRAWQSLCRAVLGSNEFIYFE